MLLALTLLTKSPLVNWVSDLPVNITSDDSFLLRKTLLQTFVDPELRDTLLLPHVSSVMTESVTKTERLKNPRTVIKNVIDIMKMR